MTKYLVKVFEYHWDPVKKGVSQRYIGAKSLGEKAAKDILRLLDIEEVEA